VENIGFLVAKNKMLPDVSDLLQTQYARIMQESQYFPRRFGAFLELLLIARP